MYGKRESIVAIVEQFAGQPAPQTIEEYGQRVGALGAERVAQIKDFYEGNAANGGSVHTMQECLDDFHRLCWGTDAPTATAQSQQPMAGDIGYTTRYDK